MNNRDLQALRIIATASLLAVVVFSFAGCGGRAETPVARHGQLSVRDGRLYDAHGEPVRLRGVSTGALNHYEESVNAETFDALAGDWGVDVVRLALAVGGGGYAVRPRLKDVVERGIDLAVERGLYVIVDWHVLVPGDPRDPIYSGAADFWREIAGKYGAYPNLIYEIMNEPNGALDWSRDVRPYAQEMVDLIRGIDPDNLIIVGTPTWSQDVDSAAADPVDGSNLAYALHFYAGSHGEELRQKAREAIAAGALVFVSEWGTSLNTGDGGPFFPESETWLSFLDENGISWIIWSLSNRDEASALLSGRVGDTVSADGTVVTQDLALLWPREENDRGVPYWPAGQLSPSGRWARRIFRGE